MKKKNHFTDEKYKRLFNDTIIFAIGSFGSKIILFFLLPLYTNALSISEYGTADLLVTISQLIIPFMSLVIFDAVLRFGLSKTVKSDKVLTNAVTILVIGTICTILITPLFGLYDQIAAYKWYLCSYIVSSMFSSTIFSYLKIIEKNKMYAKMSIFQTLSLALLNILLLIVFKMGVKGYILSGIISFILTSVIIVIEEKLFLKIKIKNFDKELCLNMIKYSSPLILNNISWWVIHSSDKIMIEFMTNSLYLGLYSVATKIPSLINMLISIFSQAWGLSSIREMEGSNDKKYYSSVFEYFSFLCFFSCIFIVGFCKIFMKLYVSSDFFEAWKYVPMLLTAAVFSAISSYFGSLYGALKKSFNNMITTFLAALINIVLNYILILKIGIFGAVISTLVSYIFIAFTRMIDILRFIKIDINKKSFMINSLLILIQSVLVSLNFHIYIVSFVIMALFVFNNSDKIRKIFNKLCVFIKRK